MKKIEDFKIPYPDIYEKIKERVTEQGNMLNDTLLVQACKVGGGFDWHLTIEGSSFWEDIYHGRVGTFFDKYPYQYSEPSNSPDLKWYKVIKENCSHGRSSSHFTLPVGAITWCTQNYGGPTLHVEDNRHTSNFLKDCFEEIPDPRYETISIDVDYFPLTEEQSETNFKIGDVITSDELEDNRLGVIRGFTTDKRSAVVEIIKHPHKKTDDFGHAGKIPEYWHDDKGIPNHLTRNYKCSYYYIYSSSFKKVKLASYQERALRVYEELYKKSEGNAFISAYGSSRVLTFPLFLNLTDSKNEIRISDSDGNILFHYEMGGLERIAKFDYVLPDKKSEAILQKAQFPKTPSECTTAIKKENNKPQLNLTMLPVKRLRVKNN